MIKFFKRTIVIVGAIAAILTMGSVASAGEYVYGSWIAAKHGVNQDGLLPFFKAVEKETGGSVKWKLLAGGQLVSARSTLPGVRDRIADAGLVIPVFNRKELGHNNVIFDMQSFGSSPVAIAGASTETIMRDCPECLAEYRKQKVVYIGGFGTTAFKLICAKPITTLAQVKGLKAHSGAGWRTWRGEHQSRHLYYQQLPQPSGRDRVKGAAARWVKAMGGIPVFMSPVDGVTAMQRGAMTCLHGPIPWLRSYGYMDVTKSIINYPMGTPRGLAMMALNRKVWNGLSTSEKKAMLKHFPSASARATLIGFMAEDIKILAAAKKKGIIVVPGGKEFADLMAKHRKSELTAIPKAVKRVGVKADAAKRIMAAHVKNLTKWEKIAAEVGTDVGKVAAAFKREIYDRIDISKM